MHAWTHICPTAILLKHNFQQSSKRILSNNSNLISDDAHPHFFLNAPIYQIQQQPWFSLFRWYGQLVSKFVQVKVFSIWTNSHSVFWPMDALSIQYLDFNIRPANSRWLFSHLPNSDSDHSCSVLPPIQSGTRVWPCILLNKHSGEKPNRK